MGILGPEAGSLGEVFGLFLGDEFSVPHISLLGGFLSSMKGALCLLWSEHCVIMMPWDACPPTLLSQQL